MGMPGTSATSLSSVSYSFATITWGVAAWPHPGQPQRSATRRDDPPCGRDDQEELGHMWITDWTARAACKGTDPDELFVQGAAQNRAKLICRGCPVRTECLADARQRDRVRCLGRNDR